MTASILERLREAQRCVELYGERRLDDGVYKEAADEIERLRSVLSAISGEPDEDDEWDGRNKFHDLRLLAKVALGTEADDVVITSTTQNEGG